MVVLLKIVECPTGYYGINCLKKCSPPTYGEDCQSLCLCSADVCHFVRGCTMNVHVENVSDISMIYID